MLKKLIKTSKNCQSWLFEKNLAFEETSKSDQRPKFFFVVSILFYGLYLGIMQPEWVFGGGMWAEMATNYYFNANDPSIIVNLFSTDAGYIPLPQRIVAYIGSALNLPSTVIPYYYTWSGILITGAMVGVFCLRPFRSLVRNDYLRLMASVSILLISDFETRTFINFTYFSAFFIAIVTALALVQRDEESPWWAWTIVVFIISKPAVLSVLPIMILTALISKKRFRLITLSATLLCIAQILNMTLNHSSGTFTPIYTFSMLDKIIATGKFFVGFLGAFSVGKGIPPESYKPLWFGSFVLIFCFFIVSNKRTNASALILVGLSTLFFNVLLNSFALSDMWNINMEKLIAAPLYRHIIVGYFGVTLVVLGLVDACTQIGKSVKISSLLVLPPLTFCLWFLLSGWFTFSGKLNRAPASPTLFNSQWQEMAGTIESSDAICIPIDPFGWMFGKNCSVLNDDMIWTKPIEYRPILMQGEKFSIPLPPSTMRLKKDLISMAVLAKPNLTSTTIVQAEAQLTMKDGSTRHLFGSRQITTSGGLLVFTNNFRTPISDIESINLEFSTPISIGFVFRDPSDHAVVLWMGN